MAREEGEVEHLGVQLSADSSESNEFVPPVTKRSKMAKKEAKKEAMVEFVDGTTKHPRGLHDGFVYRIQATYSTQTRRRLECRRYGKEEGCKGSIIAELEEDGSWRCVRVIRKHAEDCPKMSGPAQRVWQAAEAAALKAKSQPSLDTKRILSACIAERVPGRTLRRGGFDEGKRGALTRRVYRIKQQERSKMGAKGLESCSYKDFVLTPEMTSFMLGGTVCTSLHSDTGPCDPLPKKELHHSKLVALARKQERTLVFKHPYSADLLSRARIISLDGTFSTTPQAFYQAVFILVELNTLVGAESEQEWAPRWVTVVVALLSGKRTEEYRLLLSQLLDIAPSLQDNLTTVYCDFEKSITKSVLSTFGGVEIAYCFFHWRECVRRKVTQSFPWKTLKAKPFLKDLYLLVVSLVFVPPGDVNEYWINLLSQEHPEKAPRRLFSASWDPFLKYFGRTFVGILPAPFPQKGIGGVCKALFPVDFWNVHHRILQDKPLTNCSAESKNLSFKRLIGGAGPTSFSRWLESVHCNFTSDSLTVTGFPPVSKLLFPSPPSSQEPAGNKAPAPRQKRKASRAHKPAPQPVQPSSQTEDPELAALRALPGFNMESFSKRLPTKPGEISSDEEDGSLLRPSTPDSEEGSDVDAPVQEREDTPPLQATEEAEPGSPQAGPSNADEPSPPNSPKESQLKTLNNGRKARFYSRRQQLLKPVVVKERDDDPFEHLTVIASILASSINEEPLP